jgi:hypothetical protein
MYAYKYTCNEKSLFWLILCDIPCSWTWNQLKNWIYEFVCKKMKVNIYSYLNTKIHEYILSLERFIEDWNTLWLMLPLDMGVVPGVTSESISVFSWELSLLYVLLTGLLALAMCTKRYMFKYQYTYSYVNVSENWYFLQTSIYIDNVW